MNLRWLVGNFTDPEFSLTRKQQREVTQLAHRRHLSKWQLAAWTVAMMVGFWMLVGGTYKLFAAVIIPLGIPYPRVTSFATLALGAIVLSAWLYRLIYIRPIRLAMRDLGHDICVNCGYRLQGLSPDTTSCPECGGARLPPEVPDA